MGGERGSSKDPHSNSTEREREQFKNTRTHSWDSLSFSPSLSKMKGPLPFPLIWVFSFLFFVSFVVVVNGRDPPLLSPFSAPLQPPSLHPASPPSPSVASSPQGTVFLKKTKKIIIDFDSGRRSSIYNLYVYTLFLSGFCLVWVSASLGVVKIEYL